MQRLAHKALDFPWYGEKATTSSLVGSPSDAAAEFQPITDSPTSSAVSPVRGGGSKTIAPRFGNNDTIRTAVKRAAGLSSQDQHQLLAASGASFSASASANVTSLSMSRSLASALFSGPNTGGISSKTQGGGGGYDASVADAIANRQSTSTAMLQRLLTAIASDPLTQRSIAMADGSQVPQSRNPTMSPSRPNFGDPLDDRDDDHTDVVISTNDGGADTDDLLNCTSSYDDALKSTAVFRIDEMDDEEQLTANAAFAAAYGPTKKNRVSSAGTVSYTHLTLPTKRIV
eukprot:TRINITY_DN39751_c0_g1_i1.p1 TRINITY_DN39751_c0_g1~~TRINITY_DN39751_c0_g1_i1.p1  ORF type:complete len:287 (-),score=62.86 TRINITY_DN39751_c0_g1_i1:122-982(-)